MVSQQTKANPCHIIKNYVNPKKVLNQIHFFTLQRFQLYKKKSLKKIYGIKYLKSMMITPVMT